MGEVVVLAAVVVVVEPTKWNDMLFFNKHKIMKLSKFHTKYGFG